MNLFAQAGLDHLGTEPRDIAQWAHRLVWTDRMLETLLNNRVKGGKWRWPNTYFTERGFWSLREAHFRFAQSCNY